MNTKDDDRKAFDNEPQRKVSEKELVEDAKRHLAKTGTRSRLDPRNTKTEDTRRTKPM